jgi:hypothetical protein
MRTPFHLSGPIIWQNVSLANASYEVEATFPPKTRSLSAPFRLEAEIASRCSKFNRISINTEFAKFIEFMVFV